MPRDGIPKVIPIKPQLTPETKCSFCTGSKCCNYTTQHIDAPRAIQDFDHLLWQLAHANVQAFKDEDGWFLLVNNPCNFLQSGGRCGIYHTRPQVCRDYDNDYCEYDEPAEKSFELFFPDYAALDAYCRARFKNWDRRFD
jgi:uncharacterized protein